MTSETGCGCMGACAPALTLDPHKRVHYAQGQVLGVDEFVQEEFYFLQGARRHHRMLHGFGTVCGLDVSARDLGDGAEGEGGIEIRVEPGFAIDTHGRELHVDQANCARIDTWLARQLEASPPLDIPDEGDLPLWVMLCYRECLTDLEPIPGGPCRTPDESMTPTRVTETFSLRFETEEPDSTVRDAIRAFGRLLRRIEAAEGEGPFVTVDQLVTEVEAINGARIPSPPPPPLTGPILVPQSRLQGYLNAAFNAWVTVVRPSLTEAGLGCADLPGGDGCIPVARLRVPLTRGEAGVTITGDASGLTVDTATRPTLLSTQVIQELLIEGAGAEGPEGPTRHNALLGLEDDDHRQYLLVQPRGPEAPTDVLVNHLSGATRFRLSDVPNALRAGDVMPWGQGAGGDLSGAYPDPTVTGLQGSPVPAPEPGLQGRHLAVSPGGGWQLVTPPTGGGGGEAGEEELVRLQALTWQHNQPNDFLFDLEGEDGVFGIGVGFGIREIGDAVVRVGISQSDGLFFDRGSLDMNSFRIYVEVPAGDNTFPFNTGGTQLRSRFRIIPDEVIPIVPIIDGDPRLFNRGQRVPLNSPATFAPGAFLRFSRDLRAQILQNGFLVWIEIDGDHVLGQPGTPDDPQGPVRAVDTEFLRSRLPSGDRPEGAERGTQGGLFSSWINPQNFDGPIDDFTDRPGGGTDRPGTPTGTLILPGRDTPITDRPSGLNLNTATVEALREDLRMSRAAATAFVAAREEAGGFRSADDIPAGTMNDINLNRIRNSRTAFFGGR